LFNRPHPAQAKSSYLAAARAQYPTIAGTALDGCSLCHTSVPNRNPYGADYKSHGHNFTAIELLDSDGDGFDNITEINAHTFPGDPGSKPAGNPTSTPVTPPPATPTPGGNPTPTSVPTAGGEYKLIGWNDLGMHCMNESFADLAVLPPYNTLWAQLIRQAPEPQIVTSDVTIEYSIIDNTYSAGKTDFWQYAQQLFGVNLPPNVGLRGASLSGIMQPEGDHFKVEGVPLTPYRDGASHTQDPYQLAHLVARDSTTGQVLAETTTVAPVSTEMQCDACHADGMREGIATGKTETNILALHDKEEHTNLMESRPVLCADCHGSNALGMPGSPNLPSLSRAMHHKHASEEDDDDDGAGPDALASRSQSGENEGLPALLDEGTENCYLCHPGQQTQCLRGTMYAAGMFCTDCHGSMRDVASLARRPWIDEPRCGDCHDPQYAENPGTLYRNSTGHGGLYCEACHGSPHAILPSTQPNDNIQNIALQGYAGPLSDCTVCHDQVPAGPGPHGIPVDNPPPVATPTSVAPTPTVPLPTPTPGDDDHHGYIKFHGTTETTHIEHEHAAVRIGAYVEVRGMREANDVVRATRLKVKE
jgi:hypothetical protein